MQIPFSVYIPRLRRDLLQSLSALISVVKKFRRIFTTNLNARCHFWSKTAKKVGFEMLLLLNPVIKNAQTLRRVPPQPRYIQVKRN